MVDLVLWRRGLLAIAHHVFESWTRNVRGADGSRSVTVLCSRMHRHLLGWKAFLLTFSYLEHFIEKDAVVHDCFA